MRDNRWVTGDSVHTNVRALLPEYLALAAEGGLPERAYPAVARHLADCPACRTEADALVDLGAAAYGGARALHCGCLRAGRRRRAGEP